MPFSHARHLDSILPALLTHAVAARVAIHHGDLARARGELLRAQMIRQLATWAAPWISVEALLELARAYLALSDAAGAGTSWPRRSRSSVGARTWAS